MDRISKHPHRQNSTDLGIILQVYVNELKAEIARAFDAEDEVHRTLDSAVMDKQVENGRTQHEQSTSQDHELKRLHENKRQELMDTLDKQTQVLKSQIENNNQLNENNLQLKEDTRRLHENNSQLEEESHQLHEIILQSKEDNRQLHETNFQLEGEKRQLHEINLQLKEDNRQLHGINLQLEEENHDLNEENELTCRLHSAHLDTLTRKLETTEAANKTLTNDRTKLQKRYEQLNNECRAHVESNSLLKITLEENKNIVTDLSKENESLKRQKKDLLDKINDVSSLLYDKLPKVATLKQQQQLPPAILGKHYDTKGKSIWWPPTRARQLLTAHDQLGDDIAEILRRLVLDLSEILTRNDDGDKLQ